MRTDGPATPPGVGNFSTLCAGILVIQIVAMGSLPFELLEPWDKLFHMIAYAALTVLLWIATDGRRPMLVIVGVMALGLADEIRQAFIPARSADALDFFVDALAAAAAGATLYWKTGTKKTCAESSQR